MPVLRKFKRKVKGVDVMVHIGADASNIVQDTSHRFVTDAEKEAWNAKPGTGGNAKDMIVDFTTATTRQRMKTGEKLSILFGKIDKYLADLRPVAFSGKYPDLTERPALGGASSLAVANNCTTTAAGSVLDARQGKTLMDKYNQVNRDLQSFQTGVDALYNKCVSLGVTPAGKTLNAITAALEAVYNKGKKDAEYKVIIKVYGVGGSADSVGSGQYTVTATSGTGSYRQGDGDTRVDISRG